MVRQLGDDSHNIHKVVCYKFDMSIIVDVLRMVFDSPEDLYIVVEPYKEIQTYF